MPDNIIRFGMSDYEGSKGFKVRNFTSFSNEIRLADIFAKMGDNMSWNTRKAIENIFNGIAGSDGVINKNELIKYFKELDKAAAEGDVGADRDILDVNEIFGLEVKRGNVKKQDTFLGIPVNVDKEMRSALGKFVKALVTVNDKMVAADKDLAARTTYNKDGSRTVKEYDIISENEWETQTQRTSTYDKNDNLIKQTYVSAQGRKYTLLYKGGHRVKQIEEDKEFKWIRSYDNKGNVIKEETISKIDNWKNTVVYSYDSKNRCTKRVETYNSGAVEESYYNASDEYSPAKTVYKDKSGKIDRIELYTYDKNHNLVKQVTKDADGNVVMTTTMTYDPNGNEIKRVESNGKDYEHIEANKYSNKGRLLETKSFFNGKPEREIEYDIYGNELQNIFYDFPRVGQITTQKEGKFGPVKAVIKDSNGNLLETHEYSYDSKGRDKGSVIKDAQGNLKATWTTTYGKNGDNRQEKRAADGTLLEAMTFEHDSKGELSQLSDEYYKDGKLLCIEEQIWDDGHLTEVYKDGDNVTISKDEFKELYKSIEK